MVPFICYSDDLDSTLNLKWRLCKFFLSRITGTRQCLYTFFRSHICPFRSRSTNGEFYSIHKSLYWSRMCLYYRKSCEVAWFLNLSSVTWVHFICELDDLASARLLEVAWVHFIATYANSPSVHKPISALLVNFCFEVAFSVESILIVKWTNSQWHKGFYAISF